ncbi:GLPGLI family protein [Porphyromonas pogonae]|uniref:GLPGLI family protein n=1 Tax=Porphyromonas pogonae TaxID=867595 RepID=UPI002E769C52|nr:GLPGLI family protein [Porphyromonas pogonae]
MKTHHHFNSIFITVCALLFPQALHAQSVQTLDSAYMKIAYKYERTRKPPRVRPLTDQLILAIGKDVSVFYSPLTFEMDTLNASPKGEEIFMKRFSDAFDKGIILSKKYMTYIFKNYPHGAVTVTDIINTDAYLYEDKLNDQKWHIEDSTKSILNYECQKATCTYRGRQWTAWFAPEIPIGNGPWLLGGLPGLIMEAYDSERLYVFTAVGLEKVTDNPIVIIRNPNMKGYVKTTRKEFLKGKEQYTKHPMAHIEAQLGIKIGDESPNQEQYEPIEFLEK